MSQIPNIGRKDVACSPNALRRVQNAPYFHTVVLAVAAAYTTSLSGSNNDMVYTAAIKGDGGNGITIAYVNPGTASAALSVGVVGQAITVNVATDAGVIASYTTSLTGTNNDLVYSAKTIGTAGNSITIAYIDPSANDEELSVEVTGTDIVVNLATDSGGAITSTAALIKAAIEASVAANALVNVANAAANDGSGVVTALAEQSLANGAAIAITSTAAQIKTAIEANATANAMVTLANSGGDDGSGVVTALAATNLTGGVDGTIGKQGQIAVDASYIYVCTADSTTAVSSWERAAISAW